jgi:hypothetical protein
VAAMYKIEVDDNLAEKKSDAVKDKNVNSGAE